MDEFRFDDDYGPSRRQTTNGLFKANATATIAQQSDHQHSYADHTYADHATPAGSGSRSGSSNVSPMLDDKFDAEHTDDFQTARNIQPSSSFHQLSPTPLEPTSSMPSKQVNTMTINPNKIYRHSQNRSVPDASFRDPQVSSRLSRAATFSRQTTYQEQRLPNLPDPQTNIRVPGSHTELKSNMGNEQPLELTSFRNDPEEYAHFDSHKQDESPVNNQPSHQHSASIAIPTISEAPTLQPPSMSRSSSGPSHVSSEKPPHRADLKIPTEYALHILFTQVCPFCFCPKEKKRRKTN